MSSRNKLLSRVLMISLVINVIGIAYIAFTISAYRSKITQNYRAFIRDYHLRKKGHFETLPNNKGEVIFLGASITDGGRWAELFQNPQIKNRGIAGDKSEDLLNRIQEVLESEPSQLFILIGYNDISTGVGIDQILKNYEEIFKETALQSPYTEIFVQSVLPINPSMDIEPYKNDSIKVLNERLEALCALKKVGFIDLTEGMSINGSLNAEYTNDGLHLNGEGYQQWKKIIQQFVKKKRQKDDQPNLREPEDKPSGVEEKGDERDKEKAKPDQEPDSTLRNI